MPRHPLVVKLKSGEYDGADLMKAWLLIEALQRENAELKERLETAVAHAAMAKETLEENGFTVTFIPPVDSEVRE